MPQEDDRVPAWLERRPGPVLAIDPGSKRVGVAVSDPRRTMSLPLAVVPARPADTLVERLAGIVDEYGVVLVVLGHPLQAGGHRGGAAREAERLARDLAAATGTPVCLYDERYTSVGAEAHLVALDVSRRRRKRMVDRIAAGLLLDSFLHGLRGLAARQFRDAGDDGA